MSEVRVRFAPSPTGALHAGNVRTALLNWIFAKQQNGSLILRIEDTDQDRHVIGSEEMISDDLKWLGLDWQEGMDVGGDYGPYLQSDRLDFHKEYADKLLNDGIAYRCYCSEEELDAARKKALAEGSQPRYNGMCREISGSEEKKKIDEGIKPVLRFKVREGSVTFNDMIKGEISWDLSNIGDFVIIRSNGMPSYNFAVVVDDALMKISHVIRGEGHVSNTPKQMLLYEALNFDIPNFAHTATILNKEKKTLSKRNGAVSINRYREEGYLPEALINYLSLLSWSSESGDDIIDMDRLISEFSFSRMSSSAAVFDDDKLTWMNGQYIRALSKERLMELSIPYLQSARYSTDDKEKTSLIVEAVRGNLSTVSEIANYASLFYDSDYTPKGDEESEILQNKDSQRIFKSFLKIAGEFDQLSEEDFRSIMKSVQEETGLKGKNLWMPVRIALTGQNHGPELQKLAEYFGKDEVLSRFKFALGIG